MSISRPLLLALISTFSITGCSDGAHQQAIADAIRHVEKNRLKTHVDALTQYGPRSVGDLQSTGHTVQYIKSLLVRYGYQPVEERIDRNSAGEGSGFPFVNIIAEHAGREASSPVLELGAHYDTVDDSPGADDNASGVAAILEVARVMASMETKRRVRFCFFALEEHGRDGSYFHVEQIRKRNESLQGAIILEMVGYATELPDTQETPVRIPLLFSPPTTGNFIAVVGNFRSGGLGNRFERAAKRYVPSLPYFSANRVGVLLKDAARSDHRPYWDSGYRAIMLTDTANFRNPNYHKASDLPATLNFDFLERVTQAIVATLLTWSG